MLLEVVRSNYFFPFIFFLDLNNRLNYRFDSRMASNFTALIHASGSTILSGIYLSNKNKSNLLNMMAYSSGFFLFDAYDILLHWKPSIMNYAYMYHHIASLYLINQSPDVSQGARILFWSEMSNLPSYFVYYYMKKRTGKSTLTTLKKLQLMAYSFIRIPVLGKILWDVYNSISTNDINKTQKYTSIAIGFPVYIMGLIWTKKLYNKL